MVFLFYFLLFSSQASASDFVRVAFFSAYHPKTGERIRLSEEGKFFHAALQVEGLWYESYPKFGSHQMDHLHQHPGLKLKKILEKKTDLTFTGLEPYLGLPFDYSYNWEDPNSSYCSKFIALLLGVEPQPMTFKSEIWKRSAYKPRGELGLSPDELFNKLKRKGFYPVSPYKLNKKSLSCKRLL